MMSESEEKQRFKAATHVIFDVDGLLLGSYNVLFSVHLSLSLVLISLKVACRVPCRR